MDQEKSLDSALEQSKQEKYNIGLTILILLAVLTLGEYSIARVGNNLAVVLMLVALLKAFLIVRDYMHIGRLFSGEEED